MENPLEAMQALDPKLMEHLKAADQLVYADGALPRKTKLLMAMAFDAAHGAVNGVRVLAGQAKAAGATKAVIAEAFRAVRHSAGCLP